MGQQQLQIGYEESAVFDQCLDMTLKRYKVATWLL